MATRPPRLEALHGLRAQHEGVTPTGLRDNAIRRGALAPGPIAPLVRTRGQHVEFVPVATSEARRGAGGAASLTAERDSPMLLIREVMYCKPGKVRPLVDKFKAMSKLSEKAGMPKMRILTDVAAEQYWTLIAEMEVESLGAFEKMFDPKSMSAEDQKEFENVMKGYHDLVDRGRREVYKIEG
jgi:hypothetical protein